MKTVNVRTASKPYEVIIGEGLLEVAGRLAAKVIKVNKAAVVTDDTVEELYSNRLEDSLRAEGFDTVKFVFQAGERSKNTNTYINLLEFLAANGLMRQDSVFALGGGVTGDLAGFAAATYLRGISFVQLPTTLLAAVDSSVGGKTGIDLNAGKNLAGSFYQPDIVICDTSTLNTLPAERLNDGCAEIIKHAMICDSEFVDILNKVTVKIEDLFDSIIIEEIIQRNVEIKSRIVSADERESGRRKLLNFGHTVGHAIEKCSGYKISHGIAVAIGMAVITRAAYRSGMCGKVCFDTLQMLLKRFGLPDSTNLEVEELFAAMQSDKKRTTEGFTIAVPIEVGQCKLITTSVKETKELLKLGLEQ